MKNIDLALSRALICNASLSDHDHDALLEHDRKTYAALLASNATSPETAMGIVMRLLAVTDGPRDIARENRLIEHALAALPVRSVIAGFVALAHRKVNNQRTSGVIRSYLFGSPMLEAIVVHHRRSVRRILTHAMGRGVAAGLARIAAKPVAERTPSEQTSLRRHVTRFAKAAELAVPCMAFVFGRLAHAPSKDGPMAKYLGARNDLESGRGLPYATLRGIASTYHKNAPRHLVPRLAASSRIKRDIDVAAEHLDTSLVGVLKRLYRSGEPGLTDELDRALAAALSNVPYWNVSLALVIDASASMRGVGHRAFSSLAIADAIKRIATARAEQVSVTWIGGASNELGLIEARGDTPLAPAMVHAAMKKPDAVIVISDGYENVESGDAERTLLALSNLGVDVPFVHILPAFTVREHVTDRTPLGADRLILETGEGDFGAMWLRLVAMVSPGELPSALEVIMEGGAK